MTNDNWNATLASLQTAYQEAEVFERFTPPAGEFDCYISNVKSGLSKKSTPENPCPYWIVQAELTNGLDEDGNSLEGKTFDFAIYSGNPKSLGRMKEFASRLAGYPVHDIIEASNLITSAMGTVSMRILVTKAPKADGSGYWTNYRILDLQHMTDADADSGAQDPETSDAPQA